MNKKIIIIIILLIIISGVILTMFLNTPKYEQIEITPNGSIIDVPANQTTYQGNINGFKIWNWNNGAVISYNTYENSNASEINELSLNAVNEIIKHGTIQNIDGVKCYVLDTDDLLTFSLYDIIKIHGKFYCIPLNNETTHDNIIICSSDKDTALHIAKSVQYKN